MAVMLLFGVFFLGNWVGKASSFFFDFISKTLVKLLPPIKFITSKKLIFLGPLVCFKVSYLF